MATTFDSLVNPDAGGGVSDNKQMAVANASEQKKTDLGRVPQPTRPEPISGSLVDRQAKEAVRLANSTQPFTPAQMKGMQQKPQQDVNPFLSTEPLNPYLGSNPPVPNKPLIPADVAYLLQAGRTGNVGKQAYEKGSFPDDFMNLSTAEILNKYGSDQGIEILKARANAATAVFDDSTRDRSYMEAAADTGIDFLGTGIGSAALSMGTAGLNLFNRNLGVAAAEQTQKITNAMEELKSDGYKARNKVNTSRQVLSGEENKREEEASVAAGNNETTAWLARVGNDVIDSIKIAADDPMMLQSGLANAAGSLVLAGGTGKVIGKAAGALIPAATSKGVQLAAALDAANKTRSLATYAMKAASVAPTMAAIGLMEGGGAFVQAATEVMDMNHEELMKGSEPYRELIKSNVEPERAKRIIAGEAGADAGLKQGISATAIGALVAKFEGNPFAKVTPRRALYNTGTQGIEETVQSGLGQLFPNLAVKEYADENKDTADSVGMQAGTGGLYGAMSAGVTQAPGLTKNIAQSAGKLALTTAKDLGKKVADTVRGRAEAVHKKNEKASPIADDVMQQASNDIEATSAADIDTIRTSTDNDAFTPEAKDQINKFAEDVVTANRYDPRKTDSSNMTPLVRNTLKGVTNKVDAIHKLSDVINGLDPVKDEAEYLDAASRVFDMITEFERLAQTNPEHFDSIPDEHPARAVLDKYAQMSANVGNSPKVLQAITDIHRMLSGGTATPVTEENINTPEGNSAMQKTILAAELTPEKVDLKSADFILQHAASGKIKLSADKLAALYSAAALVRGAQEYDAETERLGLRKQDIVSKQIKTDDSRSGEGQYSALQHAKRIRSAYDAGNLKLATAYLEDFMQFVEHMQNKVGALNKHLATGNGDKDKSVHYRAINSERVWGTSVKGMGVNPRKEGSVKFAQQVGMEAKFVADLANALVSAFPELKVKHIKPTLLDSRLNRPAKDVVRDNATNPITGPARNNKSSAQTESVPFNRATPESLKPSTPAVTNKEESVKFTRKTASELIEDTVTSNTDSKPVAEEITKPAPVNKKAKPKKQPKPPKATKPEVASEPVVEEQPKSESKPEPVVDTAEVETTPAPETETVTEAPAKPKTTAKKAKAPVADKVEEQPNPYTIKRDGDTLDVVSSNPKDANERLEITKWGISNKKGHILNKDGNFVPASKITIASTSDVNPENTAYTGSQEEMQEVQQLVGEMFVAENMGNKSERNELAAKIADIVSGYTKPKTKAKNKKATVADELGKKTEETAPEKSAPTNFWEMETAYRGLRGSTDLNSTGPKNYFKISFKLPKEVTSRLTNMINPLETFKGILSSREAWEEFTGKELGTKYSFKTKKRYQELLREAEIIKQMMNERMLKFADGKGERADSSHYLNGRVMNIVDEVDGVLKLNDSLIDSAILAALQWRLTANNTSSIKDERDVASILNKDESEITDYEVDIFNNSMTTTELANTLGRKIASYWGFRAKNTAYVGNTQGIPVGVALELIDVLVEREHLFKSSVVSAHLEGKSSTVNVFSVNHLSMEDPIRENPSLIDEAVLTEPTDKLYLGEEEKPPVARKQMRNRRVDNTPNQRKALRNEQNTKFFLHEPMVHLYEALGKEELMKIMGYPDAEVARKERNSKKAKPRYNENHLRSLEGKNLSFTGAFDQFTSVVTQVRATTDDIGSMVMRYAYNMSRVGRMQMLGKYNPQASKLMREIALPTYAVVDLSNTNNRHYTNFSLGMAQALGVKIHNMSTANSIKALEGKLNGELQPAVEVMKEFHSTGNLPEGATEIIRDAVGGSFVAMQALSEYGRYLAASESEKAEFRTPLYVEADGVHNGASNAIQLLTSGKFTIQWVNNSAKGGLYFSDRTMNEHRELHDSVDLYEDVANKWVTFLNELSNELAPESQGMLNQMATLMDILLPDIKITDDGNLVIYRGLTKNPITISIYGSGSKGIAGKLVKAMEYAIYERMSDILQSDKNSTPGMAMFRKQASSEAHAEEMLTNFMNALNVLTRDTVEVIEYGQYVVSKGRKNNVPTNTGDIDPHTFTLSPDALAALTLNMKNLMVRPLRKAINEAMGKSLVRSTELIQQFTQAQSIILQDKYKQAVDAKLAEKELTEPTWRKSDFLTQAELDDIQKSLDAFAPMVETGEQTFYFAGSETSEFAGLDAARSFNEDLRSPLMIAGPKQVGVGAIPGIVIGMGDGAAMQNAATDPKGPKNTLKIFDGMHMKLTTILEDSAKMNEAVYQSWRGNPLQHLLESFEVFADAADLSTLSESARKDLTRVFNPDLYWAEGILDAPAITTHFAKLGKDLEKAALSVQARHNVLDKVNLNVDQMAAVGSPYRKRDGIDLSHLNKGELVLELNRMYVEELENLTKQKDVDSFTGFGNKKVTDKPAKIIASDINTDKMPWALKQVVHELNASKAVHGFTVAIDTSIDHNGYFNAGTGEIVLASHAKDVLVHELIHAATVQAVYDFYNGTSQNKDVNMAIRRIEKLMHQWVKLENKVGVDERIEQYFNTAKATGTVEDKTRALNEFMAYVLSDKEAIAKAKATPALVRVGKAVIAAIKRLFGSMGLKAAAKDDVFSNLLFNTAIIMHSQPAAGTLYNDTVLYHNAAYGNDPRLTEVDSIYRGLITDYANKAPIDGPMEVSNTLHNTYKLMKVVQAHGFPMNMQQQSVFEAVTVAMATATEIDPNAMSRAQELFRHITKNLTVEHFMKDPNGFSSSDRYYAQEKFNVIMGNYGTEKDKYGRSSLLPVFVGLSMVSDELRNVLRTIDVPVADKEMGNDLDTLLSNAGVWAMQKLSTHLSGDSKAKNVQEALDALTVTIADNAKKRETFYDAVATPTGRFVDRGNEIVTDGLTRLSNYLMDKGKDLQKNGTNKYAKAAGRYGELMASIISEDNAQIVSQGIMTAMNQGNVWVPLHELIGDVIGRTESNANVYDLIKPVRGQSQQDRQQFREHLPSVIAKKFSRKLTEQEWSSLHTGLGKTDLVVLRDTMSMDEIGKVLTNQKTLDTAISRLETELSKQDSKNWKLVQQKAAQLAGFMMGGEVGSHLLRNAAAIAELAGLSKGVSGVDATKLDKLITLYAINRMSPEAKVDMEHLMSTEREGMDFSMAYMKGQRVEEQRKAATNDMARLNAYKGFIPVEDQQGVNLIVADDSEYASLMERSYERIGTYVGSRYDPNRTSRGYYFSPVAPRSPFSQGIMQNVRESVNGVDAHTGFTIGSGVVNRITDPTAVARITRAMTNRNDTSAEPLIPVFNDKGKVIAYEMSIDPSKLSKLNQDTHFGKMLGIWRGRQVEEIKSQKFNTALITELHRMHSADIKDSPSNQSQYINVLDQAELDKDPVLADALRLMSKEVRDFAEDLFGEGELWVRREMLNDSFGYRFPSVGDAWTGTNRFSKETNDMIRTLMMSFMGNSAYRKLVNAENTVKQLVNDAKTIIVVKSVIIPTVNFLANIYQLIGRGVPMKAIFTGMPKKIREIRFYEETYLRRIDAEAELRAAEGNPNLERKLKAEIQSISDSHRRLSIWPLLEAGEFSSIADAGISRDEILIPDGKVYEYMTRLVDKLPEGVRNAGRYGLITKDTALFQGIQKAVEYSDFIAKAILFDDITQRLGKDKKYALGRVTEEFINYDRLPGRNRAYLEGIGLMWFYNFKIRSVKIALSMIRNNPVHSLISTLAPAPTMFGNVGLPIEDNMFSALVDGRLGTSFGIGQGLRAPSLNPWHNLIN